MASGYARRFVSVGLKMARAVSTAQRLPGARADGMMQCPQAQSRAVSTTFEPGFHWRKMVQAHHMSCCANLGNPPPRELMVEYDEESDFTDYFIELADKVAFRSQRSQWGLLTAMHNEDENAHPELAVLSISDNATARKGSFEITCDDQLLWSKLQKGRLPRFEDVLDAIAELPSKCEIEPAAAKSASA